MATYIYALTEPDTGEIRYIGKSIRPLGRLADHCNDPSKTHRTNWIQSLLSNGKRPGMVVLEEVADGDRWQDVERAWIARGRSAGWRLTNCTSGGDGVSDLPPESRERIVAAWRGRKHRPESLAKMSISNRGRVHTEDHKRRMGEIMTGRKIAWTDKIARANEKLADEQVREIRFMLSIGESQYALADAYGVHQGTICNIKRGLCYAHVDAFEEQEQTA